ncbi:MAG: orotate phosphoribosyltransferase [Bacteroidales bacterium]|nr:orotate phosphoribosyltransferase [Bacteroidales bacterium]MCF8345004.1 orotate phosphoribosyltransferase [Bacteroidales bacterium]MCF8352067.1 orotate phosphoribosyltransferase [Bacteroidales bacterium]MCF8377494.1 orotate phosphoribosyltransferase [Bacteroidales bacterium]MCF8401617.1 orotate phosphoribosyltransferase [Bacteroidales bacterium]
MKFNAQIARQVSDYLLQIEAVKLNPENPFTWASGLRSPIYCDNRVTLSYPEIRTYIKEQFCAILEKVFNEAEVVAGVATGGIAQGALVAQEFNLPFVYIRSSEKSHGLENKIEGHVNKGQKVVVIEDLVSTGGSSLRAATALRDAGCEVVGMAAIFSYNLDVALKNFDEAKVQLRTLADYESLIHQAIETEYVTKNQMESLLEWRKDPKAWGAKFE